MNAWMRSSNLVNTVKRVDGWCESIRGTDESISEWQGRKPARYRTVINDE